jgi:hypothetical protein
MREIGAAAFFATALVIKVATAQHGGENRKNETYKRVTTIEALTSPAPKKMNDNRPAMSR